jgi:hypothetical protein
MGRRRRLSRKDFLGMNKRLSREDFRKLMDILMQEGPKVEYRDPDRWRNY